MTEPPRPLRQGQAWREDWPLHLAELLRLRGYATVTSFLRAHPHESLLTLADSFTDAVAAVQLEWTYVDEAKASGRLEACALDLLIRAIHEHFSEGWTHDDTRAHGMAFSGWSAALKRVDTRCETLAIWEAVAEAAPAGWLPAADDPLIAQAFRAHWGNP